MEILTNILNEEQIRRELAATFWFLSRHGVKEVSISFEFTFDSPDLDDFGNQYVAPVAEATSVVAAREQTKGFVLGKDDCWIEAVGIDARFLFCNDRDIHFTSESAELLDCVRAQWREAGFHVYPDDLLDAV